MVLETVRQPPVRRLPHGASADRSAARHSRRTSDAGECNISHSPTGLDGRVTAATPLRDPGAPPRDPEGALLVHLLAHRAAAGSGSGACLRPDSGTPRTDWITISAAATLMQTSATLKIGQVRQLQEVDDVAAQRSGIPEEPIGEVTGDPGQQQTERPGPGGAPHPAGQPAHGQEGEAAEDCDHRGHRGAGAERRAGGSGSGATGAATRSAGAGRRRACAPRGLW